MRYDCNDHSGAGWWRVDLFGKTDTIEKTGKSGRSFDWIGPAIRTTDAATTFRPLVSVPQMISTRCLKVSQRLQETESIVSNGRRIVSGVVGARPRRTFTKQSMPLGPTAGHRTPGGSEPRPRGSARLR
jgi:hypothetical protein